MKREILGIEHRDILKDKLRSLCKGLSEYSFANLYLFRRKHEYEVIFDEHIAVCGRTYDNHIYLMPLFDISAVNKEFLARITQGVHFLFPIHESALSPGGDHRCTVAFNKDDSDYIYSSEKFRTYGGCSLRGKKNLAKRFLENYMPQALPLDDNNRDDAISVLKHWQKQAGTHPDSTDYIPCIEALALRESLELFGFIYYIRNVPCGFLMAEELTPEMCVLHFYKGNTEFKGIYEYMFHYFANHYSQQYRYFNFEQDLGLPGLQKSKSQYSPDYMNNKYRVTFGHRAESHWLQKELSLNHR